ncbi:MAG: GGDEF domain-containing protein, partial [Desulfofustis sp.]|nr:GGDEF domain-containing protein [Desulfofustis sp.]
TDTVARTGDTIVIERVDEHPMYINSTWVNEGWKGSIIGLPFKTGNEVLGVMNIAYRSRQEFTESRLRLLGLLSDQGAIAINNARLHNFVKHQAVTDSLTGTANRRAFNDRLEEEIRRSKRYDHRFSLLILDLDGFKAVNDTYGHLVGDQTLQGVADCLQSAVRDTDFLARYGGDEFALILPETTCESAHLLVDKINTAMAECHFPWLTISRIKTLTISTGIACFPRDAENADGLIYKADAELYRRKRR